MSLSSANVNAVIDFCGPSSVPVISSSYMVNLSQWDPRTFDVDDYWFYSIMPVIELHPKCWIAQAVTAGVFIMWLTPPVRAAFSVTAYVTCA